MNIDNIRRMDVAGTIGKCGALKNQATTNNQAVTDSFTPGKKGKDNIEKLREMAMNLNGSIRVEPDVMWEFPTQGAVLATPVLGPDNTLFSGSDDGKVYALDTKTGAKKWDYETKDRVFTTVKPGNLGMLYILGTGDDRKLHAVDEVTGDKIWEFDPGSHPGMGVEQGPDGTVYMGSGVMKGHGFEGGKVFAVDGENGKKLWEYDTDNWIVAAPKLGPDGTLYATGDNNDNRVYALDSKTGKEKWKFKAGGWITSTPVIGPKNEIIFGCWDKKVYSLDGNTGKKLWEMPTGGDVRGNPLLGSDGTVYVGSRDGNVYALDSRDGAVKWKRKAGTEVVSSPVMDKKGNIYVGDVSGKVVAFDSRNGHKKWEFQTHGKIIGSPAVSDDGIVFVGSADKTIYALDTNKLEKIISGMDTDDNEKPENKPPLVIDVQNDFVVIGGVKVPRKKVSADGSSCKPQSAPEASPSQKPIPRPHRDPVINTLKESKPVITAKPAQVSSKSAPPEKDLTVLFYMNGQYADIGDNVATSMLKLEKAGSDEHVNMVAQLGRQAVDKSQADPNRISIDNDWSGVRRYEVKHDSHESLNISLADLHKLEKQIPSNPLLHYCIGDEYWKNGDKTKAEEYFNKARVTGIEKFTGEGSPIEKMRIYREFDTKAREMHPELNTGKVFASAPLTVLDPSTKMSEPSTLQDFITWGMKKYPAKKFMLVVMGHGFSWRGVAGMTTPDLSKAIKQGVQMANIATGRKKSGLDAVVLNSCEMGTVETAAQLKETADVLIASQNAADASIFNDWHELVEIIQKHADKGESFDARSFSREMVRFYSARNKETKENFPDFYPLRKSFSTLSAIDNRKLGGLVSSWKKFVRTCEESGVTDQQLFGAIKKAKNYAAGDAPTPDSNGNLYEHMRDIGDMMDKVKSSENMPETVRTAADDVRKSLEDTIIAEQHEGPGEEGSHGLSIWAPTSGVDVVYLLKTYHNEVDAFARETGWSQKLLKAINNVPKEILVPFMENIGKIEEMETKTGSSDISAEEKKTLEGQIHELKKEQLALKVKLDFTI